MSGELKRELHDLVNALGGGVREVHYRPAHDAAQEICSGVYETIPIRFHDLVHEAALAGYAAALADLERGKLDDQVRTRLELIDDLENGG
ncbi:hypothetical protein AB0F32_29040 [Streptomyces albidoflavus]|uniref:hypothetical protein n=1 Tax=Streptomyces TaxID=1883 RepID=UPI001FFE640F|nr:hypothetical protein [Streptomyces sp. WAC00276]MCK2143876.1 hypothetical protein [Streptomyces sp. WAC00276]